MQAFALVATELFCADNLAKLFFPIGVNQKICKACFAASNHLPSFDLGGAAHGPDGNDQ